MRAEFAVTSFENKGLDLAACGAFSVTNKLGADRNRAEVIIQSVGEGGSGPDLTVQACDCFPEENFESCTNQVKVTL